MTEARPTSGNPTIDPGAWTSVSGLLPVHKPLGMVSKDVSRWLERRWGRKSGIRIGHVGTLDPLAEGVLPVLIGKATRFQDLLLDSTKAYEFDVAFGYETSTLDREGAVVREISVPDARLADLQGAAASFIGDVDQVPPIYSAVKVGGRALHEIARGGDPASVDLNALKRRIHIESIDVIAWNPERKLASFVVRCSKGTYVRVLAKDIAQKLGTCGTVTRLVRTCSAGVSLPECLSLEAIEARWSDPAAIVIPIERFHFGVPRWSARAEWAARLSNGQRVVSGVDEFWRGCSKSPPEAPSQGICVMTREDGRVFGIGEYVIRPRGDVEISMKRGM